MKSFGHWLVKDRRGPENPFAHLSRLNARVDVRHERRALLPNDLTGLIAETEKSQETFRGLNGAARAMLYRVAAMTGLRASELARLTSASFDLAADVPTITLTMDRYTHLGLIDMNSALGSLPTIAAPESQTMRATGTTDDAADFSCTKSCTRPAENGFLNGYQPPRSPVPMSRQKCRKPRQNTKF